MSMCEFSIYIYDIYYVKLCSGKSIADVFESHFKIYKFMLCAQMEWNKLENFRNIPFFFSIFKFQSDMRNAHMCALCGT